MPEVDAVPAWCVREVTGPHFPVSSGKQPLRHLNLLSNFKPHPTALFNHIFGHLQHCSSPAMVTQCVSYNIYTIPIVESLPLATTTVNSRLIATIIGHIEVVQQVSERLWTLQTLLALCPPRPQTALTSDLHKACTASPQPIVHAVVQPIDSIVFCINSISSLQKIRQ